VVFGRGGLFLMSEVPLYHTCFEKKSLTTKRVSRNNPGHREAMRSFYLRILVYLVIYDCG